MTQVDNVSEENSRERNSRQFLLLLIFFQTIFIILFGFFVKYDENWNDEELTRNRLKIVKNVKNKLQDQFLTVKVRDYPTLTVRACQKWPKILISCILYAAYNKCNSYISYKNQPD